MHSLASKSQPDVAESKKSQLPSPSGKGHVRGMPTAIVTLLLGVFFLLQSRIPLGTAVQIGADEGFELAKATLCLHGHKLYSEIWNDQPPLHKFLITPVLKSQEREHFTDGKRHRESQSAGPSIRAPRIVTTAFTGLLLVGLFVITHRISGLLVGTLTTGLLIASPGFLELSSSCMLEIPSLAMALAGLSVLLILPRTKWYGTDCFSGGLFGIAALIKLVPIYLLPLAAVILWLRWHEASPSFGLSASGLNRFRSELPGRNPSASWTLPTFWKLLMGLSLISSFAFVDWLIEDGAYLAHFQQSWSSHFGGAKSFEYGSPAEHAFDWSVLARNWDVTVPAVVGISTMIIQLRKSRAAILPLAWLALSLIVFTNHKPWWPYYYVHVAIPLCWSAAVGIESVCAALSRRVRGLDGAERKRRKNARFNRWRAACAFGPAVLFALCGAGWMGARVYFQITGIRSSPQVYTELVLKEIERLKPFSRWLYTDQLVYSYHADIPMPPPLAVVPLKRLWTGDMTNKRIAAELSRFKPEIILLRNDTREVPFQDLLDTEYRMIYQDDRQRLYADPQTIKRADSLDALAR
jgi:hypothetical protein